MPHLLLGYIALYMLVPLSLHRHDSFQSITSVPFGPRLSNFIACPYCVEDPCCFQGKDVKCQGHCHLEFYNHVCSTTQTPFDPQPSNFIGWLPILSRRPLQILRSVTQRSRSRSPSVNNQRRLLLTVVRFGGEIDHDRQITLNDFEISRSKVKVNVTLTKESLSNQ